MGGLEQRKKRTMPGKRERRRKTLIVGLGRTGLSCARYLATRGVASAVTDRPAARIAAISFMEMLRIAGKQDLDTKRRPCSRTSFSI